MYANFGLQKKATWCSRVVRKCLSGVHSKVMTPASCDLGLLLLSLLKDSLGQTYISLELSFLICKM